MTRITLGHGAGGRLTADLIQEVFLKRFGSGPARELGDSAVLPPLHGPAFDPGADGGGLALTTDGFVVTPIFFPGGDIGKLAVCGTINDLAVAGARPAYLTASVILEEGLPLEELERVVDSMAVAARKAGVTIVAGDTKVVERGSCDKMFITTTGVGVVRTGLRLGPGRVRPGDRLVLNGPIGQHGVAVLSRREGVAFKTTVRSDCASVAGPIGRVLERLGSEVRWMRDPTRGGVATVSCELAEEAGLAVVLDEAGIPVPGDVRGACEMLGLDPLYVANEGKVLLVVSPEKAEAAGRILREAGEAEAAVIGVIKDPEAYPGPGAYLRTAFGGTKPLDRLEGDQLPRIC